MKTCNACGQVLADGATACARCGRPVGPPVAQQTQNPTGYPPAPVGGQAPQGYYPSYPPPLPANGGNSFVEYGVGLIPLALYAMMCLFLLLISGPRGFSGINLRNVTLQTAPMLPLYVAAALTIRSRGLDLSLAAIFSLGAFIGATAGPIPALLVTAVCGLLNGALIVGLKLPAIPASLVTATIYMGVCTLGTDGMPIMAERRLLYGNGALYVVPLLCIAGAFAYNFFTPLGRSQQERTKRPNLLVDLLAYCAGGFLAGIGGMLMFLRVQSYYPGMGGANYYILLVTVWAALRSTKLVDNRFGPVLYAVVLACTNAILNNALNLLAVSAFMQQIAQGGFALLFLLGLGIVNVCSDNARTGTEQ